MKRAMFFTIFIILMLVLMFGILGCDTEAEAENVIKVAVIGPMDFTPGEMHWAGATMGAEEINLDGGVKVGDEVYQIELIKVDTDEENDPGGASSAVERVITVDNADFLIGGFRTEAVMAYSDMIATDYQKIFLICGAATDEILKGKVDEDYDTYKYLFRVAPIRSSDLVKISLFLVLDVASAMREELGIEDLNVAVIAERAEWTRGLVQVAPALLEQVGLNHVITVEPSPTATDVTAELRAIEAAGAHIIYTAMAGSVGVPYARQWGELQIPAASVAINAEAMKGGFWEATDGMGNYEYTLNFFARVAQTEETIPFYDKFVERYGEPPHYTASTYEALYILKEAIERAGSLDTDAVIGELEKTDRISPSGRIVFDELHDVIWGPGYVTGLGIQWQDGELVGVWPHDWRPDPANPDLVISYEGSKPYVLPPWVVEYWENQ